MRALIDLVLARECAGCAIPGTLWCPACDAEARAAGSRSFDVAGLRVHCAASYEGVIRGLLISHKERGQAPLCRTLAGLLRIPLHRFADAAPLALVPVPGAPGADRQRGYRPLDDIARAAAAGLRRDGVPALVRPVAVPARRRTDQVGLDPAARRTNLAGSIVARAVPSGETVVLVDDIVTTGATLAELARALRAVGCEPAGGAVVAVAGSARAPVGGSLPIGTAVSQETGLAWQGSTGSGSAPGIGDRRL